MHDIILRSSVSVLCSPNYKFLDACCVPAIITYHTTGAKFVWIVVEYGLWTHPVRTTVITIASWGSSDCWLSRTVAWASLANSDACFSGDENKPCLRRKMVRCKMLNHICCAHACTHCYYELLLLVVESRGQCVHVRGRETLSCLASSSVYFEFCTAKSEKCTVINNDDESMRNGLVGSSLRTAIASCDLNRSQLAPLDDRIDMPSFCQ